MFLAQVKQTVVHGVLIFAKGAAMIASSMCNIWRFM